MIVYDSHLHVGMLADNCLVHPKEVLSFVSKHQVVGGIIMPTARIDGGDELELNSLLYKEAKEIGFNTALYVNKSVMQLYEKGKLDASHSHCVLKLHPEAVNYTDEEIEYVCLMAKEMGKPLFIHTGGNPSCHSLRFEAVIREYPSLIFILCHARPSEEALYLLEKYFNVWIDTAFLSIEKLKKFVLKGYADRILFGSDYPTNRWFYDIEDSTWYQEQINEILSSLPNRVAIQILCKNFQKLFNLKI